MRKFAFHRWSAAALAAAGLVFTSALGAQPWVSDDDRLVRGDVLINFKEVPNQAVSEVQAQIYLDAPPELVWSVLTDYAAYGKIFGDVSQAEVLDRKGNQVKVKFTINNIWPLPNTVYTELFTEAADKRSLSWKLLEGGFKSDSGSASMEKFPADKNTTKLTYSFIRDPGGLTFFTSVIFTNRSLVIDRLLALKKEIRERKRVMDGNHDPNIQPKWDKAEFWWEKPKEEPKKEEPKKEAPKKDDKPAPPKDEKPKADPPADEPKPETPPVPPAAPPAAPSPSPNP